MGLDTLQFSDAAWGDYDNDGDLDLVHAGVGGNPLNPSTPAPILTRIRRYITEDFVVDSRTGDTTFIAIFQAGTSLPGVSYGATAWHDFTGDGLLDLALSGLPETGTPLTHLYLNTGNPAPFALHLALPGLYAGDLAWGDIDNDGDADLLATGLDADGIHTTTLYQNRSDQSSDALPVAFEPVETSLPGLAYSDTAWGDYDGDGDLDLVLAGLTDAQEARTLLYRNDDGVFAEAGADLAGLFYPSVAWGDYDSDGDLDLAVSGAVLSPFILEGRLVIYRNDGGRFTDIGAELPGRYYGSAAWQDLDEDGDLDLVLAGGRRPANASFPLIYANDGDDRFSELRGLIPTPGGSTGGSLFGVSIPGDYDGDGHPDLLILGQRRVGSPEEARYAPHLDLYRNRTGIPNAPPSSPSNLVSNVDGASVTLSWLPATDDKTPAPGLSYNLRVGTAPGAIDVVSPMSNLDTGRRMIPARGNAGHNTRWRLRDLPPGTYYWSVQAIDASYLASPFADEGSFTIALGP